MDKADDIWCFCVKNWPYLARLSHFSPTELAFNCHISLRQIQRHFHDIYGLQLRQWLNDLRLQDARQLLNPERSVKEVAFLLHFKQSNHFVREFKKKYGMTPEDFSRSDAMRNSELEMEYLQIRQERSKHPIRFKIKPRGLDHQVRCLPSSGN